MAKLHGFALGIGIVMAAPSGTEAFAQAPTLSLDTSRLPRLGTVDERYQSYNVEMVEVTGGEFWKPYRARAAAPSSRDTASGGNTPAGTDSNLFEYRAPIDLHNPRLRRLAAALGPAYLRVSGTWANTTYFPERDETLPAPPAGFNGVLERGQWKGVIDFAGDVDAKILTSMAIGPGARDAAGLWKSDQARRLFAYTKSLGGKIAAVEFMNEPNARLGAPKGYDARAYGRDFKAFRAFVRESEPGPIVLGPGSVGETAASQDGSGAISTRDMLAASGPDIDAFSYHYYGAASQRCAGISVMPQTTPAAALSEEWLSRTDQARAFYQKLRDEFEPGRPMWLTETADAACGGNPWASTFLDTFRYLDQLGRLAKAGVQVVAHNTLAASDYGLLDEKTFAPRPNYWAALLWRQLMGATVLDAGVQQGRHIYAHCQRAVPGAVTILIINTDKTAAVSVLLPAASERYVLSADELESAQVKLNGTELALGSNDDLPDIVGVRSPPGLVAIAPATIAFITIKDAGNPVCN
jgi:hypothetical protein